ncbi:MAG: type III pantothenate kinase [Candidatus Heteroscillospira sp.]|jgi:type III pantothenate kinase
MILALDVGNTNIVVGIGDTSESMFKGRLTTNKSGTTTEYAIRLRAMLELYGVACDAIEGSIISSVVPELTYALTNAVELLTGKTPLVVKYNLDTGMQICIDDPRTMGADRIVGSVAAMNEYPLPLAVFDLGTANTMDVVDDKRRHLGGVIWAGIKTSLNALAANTSQLPHIEFEAPKSVIGTNTIDCMRSGIVFGNAAMMDGLIDRVEAELGKKLTVVATGGLARSVIAHCSHEIVYDEDLLIKGLIIIYYRNIGK